MASTKWLQENYIKANWFAARAHRNQMYPGTELPYLMHLNFVCMEVLAAFAHEPGQHDENLAMQCALLHDVIEDTETTYSLVKAEFGTEVADGVMALSKDKAIDKSRQMKDSLQRIQQQPKAIWLVKLGDRISNLQPPPAYWTKEKKASYREEAVRIHQALKEASVFLAERLLSKIENYAQFLTPSQEIPSSLR